MFPLSSLPGIVWPAFPDARTSALLGVYWQLEQTQWWPAARIRAHQELQLRALLEHATTTTPHYYGMAGLPWSELPVLPRAEVIAADGSLLSKQYPAAHGGVVDNLTSRTSGEPVRVKSTGVMSLLWKAMTLRDHAWHRRDLTAKLCIIRYTGGVGPPPDGIHHEGWGPATEGFHKAPMAALSIGARTDEQVDWLLREDPDYLLVYPSALEAIVRMLEERGLRLPRLRQVRTISEALQPDLRARCREVLGVPLVDNYSAQEVGHIALQCPDHEHYHVMCERVLVEVLRDDGSPCEVGETGRVVITDLHNFATPLIRYEIADYAEVGPPCPCGRGLPVLRRIVGRRRNMVVYPDGRTAWPAFAGACREAARYRDIQVVQEEVHALRLRVVPDGRSLTDAERAALTVALQQALDHPFAVTIEEVAELGRSPAGKLEEFVSKVKR